MPRTDSYYHATYRQLLSDRTGKLLSCHIHRQLQSSYIQLLSGRIQATDIRQHKTAVSWTHKEITTTRGKAVSAIVAGRPLESAHFVPPNLILALSSQSRSSHEPSLNNLRNDETAWSGSGSCNLYCFYLILSWGYPKFSGSKRFQNARNVIHAHDFRSVFRRSDPVSPHTPTVFLFQASLCVSQNKELPYLC